MDFLLNPGKLTYANIIFLLTEDTQILLSEEAKKAINSSYNTVKKIVKTNKTIYGINTGFGALAGKAIDAQDLENLQTSLILSHAAGIGEYLDDTTVRLILLLKINSLARGFSGVQLRTIEVLMHFFNAKIYPCIPAKGSVGASGDLAPLAHLSATLLGVGEVSYEGKIITAAQALKKINRVPLQLAPKEGLALINGTQVSTALAIINLLVAEKVFFTAITAGALSVDAARASDAPFDARIQTIRGHEGQIKTAAMLRILLQESEIRASHSICNKVQDPYSLRCQPQVMGACLTQLNYAASILLIEANAVSDNPLVFAEDDAILSGGNFHAEPVAFAADAIAIALAEIGALSERRIALLMDDRFSCLPPFLVENAGMNSGFMVAQVTAAALASENKSLAHPASVDSLPTSANQEDHVSMATFAARRLGILIENTAGIIAIEMLAACQGIDFLKPLKTSPILMHIHKTLREQIKFYAKDRYFAPDIAAAKTLVLQRKLLPAALNDYLFLQ